MDLWSIRLDTGEKLIDRHPLPRPAFVVNKCRHLRRSGVAEVQVDREPEHDLGHVAREIWSSATLTLSSSTINLRACSIKSRLLGRCVVGCVMSNVDHL